MSDPYILIVDDEPDIRSLVQEILEDEGYNVSVAQSGERARAMVAEQTPQLVLLDIWMPDEDGVSLLKDWRESGVLDFPVVMISGHGTVETAVEATRHGAVDFIEKPLSLAKLVLTVEKALQARVSTDPMGHETPFVTPLMSLVGNSTYMTSLRQQVTEVAANERGVLISGEAASGRTLVAQHIHASGARGRGPFIVLSCDSISPVNAERELLGDPTHPNLNVGYLEAATGGTLFLRDIEQLPQAAQALLLETLEKREIRKRGPVARQVFNARLVCSTGGDLVASVQRGAFLSALYAHLSQDQIITRPLREHPEDIPVLLEYYVNWFVENESLPYRHFTVAAQNRLRNMPWPGNLLELKNLVQRLMILSPGVEIDVAQLSEFAAPAVSPSAHADAASLAGISLDLPLREARAAFERAYMLHQLHLAEGNIGELSKRVGMERTHLYRKLRTLEIDLGKVRD